MSRNRAWCFTVNNYTEEEYVGIVGKLSEKGARYYCIGKEVGKEGTPHLQGFVYFSDAKTFSSVKKMIPRAHLETMVSTPEDASAYCKKEGNYVEHGKIPNQGKRVDLDEIKQDIVNGKKVDEICLENPIAYHQYGRTLHKIEDIMMRRKIRDTPTGGIWYYGPTGAGKSKLAFKNYHHETHYVWNLDNNWNDGYTQQPYVIINDFRGQIKFSQLLNMCDINNVFFAERRGRERLVFTSKEVIITSALRPEEIYKNLDASDKWEQFYRRFRVYDIDMKKKFDKVLKELKTQ